MLRVTNGSNMKKFFIASLADTENGAMADALRVNDEQFVVAYKIALALSGSVAAMA